jgi:hypothetical protein
MRTYVGLNVTERGYDTSKATLQRMTEGTKMQMITCNILGAIRPP